MINKILIANRGEIAVRVIRTAQALGYRTVAVYSEADDGALHMTLADEAVAIGPAPATASYLRIEAIIDAANRTGADAIHPGYGFLSENADFARACKKAGITFIGPPADAIELMGSKRLSKLAMIEADVPCIPGYQGAEQGDDILLQKAGEIGFPLMVKASAGGGGRGMRLVHQDGDLLAEIKTARSEAQNAFGSGELILEKAVLEPRHIEIQVFADQQGNVIYLGERDCSIQRRHQKVVEEAPSPFVDDDLRRRMGETAVNAAKACGYQGAGTVEFLVDKDKHFYFLEMNTRLQVEHPVTELITGQDLVAWQIKVASGEALPLTQEQVTLNGHAMEVRLYAEDPRQGDMPQTGSVLQWCVPTRNGVRVDAGIQTGQTISPHYDPMLAKIIAWGENREEARRRLITAVEDTILLGVHSNKDFLTQCLRHAVFQQGEATTDFIARFLSADKDDDTAGKAQTPTNKRALARTLALAGAISFEQSASPSLPTDRGTAHFTYRFAVDPAPQFNEGKQPGDTFSIDVTRSGDCFSVQVLDEVFEFEAFRFTTQAPLAESDHTRSPMSTALSHTLLQTTKRCEFIESSVRRRLSFSYEPHTKRLAIDAGQGHYLITDQTLVAAKSTESAATGEVLAPMDGAVVDVQAAQGDRVEAGQTLLVVEAMKMEHALKAGVAGIVEKLSVTLGAQVKTKEIVAVVTADQPLNDAKDA